MEYKDRAFLLDALVASSGLFDLSSRGSMRRKCNRWCSRNTCPAVSRSEGMPGGGIPKLLISPSTKAKRHYSHPTKDGGVEAAIATGEDWQVRGPSSSPRKPLGRGPDANRAGPAGTHFPGEGKITPHYMVPDPPRCPEGDTLLPLPPVVLQGIRSPMESFFLLSNAYDRCLPHRLGSSHEWQLISHGT